MKRTSRTIKKFGIVEFGLVSSEDEFRAKLLKRGYHAVVIEKYGDEIQTRLLATCIYIRNLRADMKKVALAMKELPYQGDTIKWETLKSDGATE